MPATGVSGVDLYAKSSHGEWMWSRGRYAFNDTIQYNFHGIDPKEQYHDLGREYRLYLPLYNEIEWLEIGVEKSSLFVPIPKRIEKPIVVYGTSIAQGGCASRPGMAWTSILERKLDQPLINLGFSGNGRMEDEVIDLLAEIDAQLYILDCLPNLTPNKDRTLEVVRDRILQSVRKLRQKQPAIPILLAEHAGYSDGDINQNRREIYEGLNKVLKEAFAELKAEGLSNIYLITKSDFGLGMEDFVDGTHPTDLGMHNYADGYENRIREILHQPKGTISTTIPVTQMREPGNYIWEERHNELLKLNKIDPPEICFFGNSITHFWGGEPEAKIVNGGKTWETNFEDLQVRNFGFGWDRIENVLWRVNHGELDGFEAKQILMMLGTNNLHLNSDDEIIQGLALLLKTMRQKQPTARVTLIGIYPRRGNEERVRSLNISIAQLAGSLDLNYLDIGTKLLGADGKIDESYFSDGLHPNEKGYRILGPQLREYLKNK